VRRFVSTQVRSFGEAFLDRALGDELTTSIHVWAGVADPALAGIPLVGLDALTLVLRSSTGATGFDRDPAAIATLRACASSLVLVHPRGTSEPIEARDDLTSVVRAATRLRAFVFADPRPELAREVATLAAYRLEVARTDLPKRYGKPFVTPVAQPIAQLFDDPPTEVAIQLATRLATAVLVFRFAGEWGLAPTVLAAAGTGAVITDQIAAAKILVVHARTQRDLPMW
jgi:hypothetical protein